MADTKLSALTALATEPADTDEFYINDGGTSKKIAWSTVKANIVDAVEGTAILSTGEAGGTKFLRENGDGTCSWQAVSAGLSEVSEDTSPTLGGDLSLGGFKLLSGASNNAIIKLGDNAGTRKFSITDSDDAEQFSVDSNGTAQFGGPSNVNRLLIDTTTGTYETKFSFPGGAVPFFDAPIAIAGARGGLNGNRASFGYNGIMFSDFISAVEIGFRNAYPVDSAAGSLSLVGNDAYVDATTNITGGSVTIRAGHGAANSAGNAHGGDLILAGGTGYGTGNSGRVRFGTHAAISGESLSGYIIIKDAGGTERKLAVVS